MYLASPHCLRYFNFGPFPLLNTTDFIMRVFISTDCWCYVHSLIITYPDSWNSVPVFIMIAPKSEVNHTLEKVCFNLADENLKRNLVLLLQEIQQEQLVILANGVWARPGSWQNDVSGLSRDILIFTLFSLYEHFITFNIPSSRVGTYPFNHCNRNYSCTECNKNAPVLFLKNLVSPTAQKWNMQYLTLHQP